MSANLSRIKVVPHHWGAIAALALFRYENIDDMFPWKRRPFETGYTPLLKVTRKEDYISLQGISQPDIKTGIKGSSQKRQDDTTQYPTEPVDVMCNVCGVYDVIGHHNIQRYMILLGLNLEATTEPISDLADYMSRPTAVLPSFQQEQRVSACTNS